METLTTALRGWYNEVNTTSQDMQQSSMSEMTTSTMTPVTGQKPFDFGPLFRGVIILIDSALNPNSACFDLL